MRLYFFSNHYISAIQHGIQGVHSFGEMVLELISEDGPAAVAGRKVMGSFLRDHKTVIVLNGGYASSLANIHEQLASIASDWPTDEPGAEVLLYGKFHEEEAALNSALTSVAVIVPECSYFDSTVPGRAEAKAALRQKMADMGCLDMRTAAASRNVFTPQERLALLCMSFPLA